MRRPAATLLILPPLLLAGCAGGPAESPFAPERSFRFEMEAQIPVPEGAGSVRIWLPIPLEEGWQEVTLLSLDGPGEPALHADALHGNRFAYWEVEAPSGEIVVRGAYAVHRLEAASRLRSGGPAPGGDPTDPLDIYLKPNRLVPVDGPVASFARAAVRGSDRDAPGRARALYDAVVSGMAYDKDTPGWGRGDARRACDLRKGNCTDFHALFIGGARSLEIPARFVMGYPLGREPAGIIPGYHCWAEFHAEGVGWVPVDASEARKHPELLEVLFGGLDPDRVSLTRGRDLILSPQQDGAPLNILFGAYVEVDGTPLALPKPLVSWDRIPHSETGN